MAGLEISWEGQIAEEEVDNLKKLEISIEEFENYILVDAKVITSKVLTPEDIIAAKQDKKKYMKAMMTRTIVKNFLLNHC